MQEIEKIIDNAPINITKDARYARLLASRLLEQHNNEQQQHSHHGDNDNIERENTIDAQNRELQQAKIQSRRVPNNIGNNNNNNLRIYNEEEMREYERSITPLRKHRRGHDGQRIYTRTI